MGIEQRGIDFMFVEVVILCGVDRRHQAGVVFMHLAPPSLAGRLSPSEGLRFDDHERVVFDCPRCAKALTPKGRDQRISKASLFDRANELLAAGQHTGKLQAGKSHA